MALSEIEQTVFAYFVANNAQDFAMVGRFWPYAELTMVLEDKIRVAVRKYGPKASAATPAAAKALIDQVIEHGAFSTVQNKFGGSMHQFQPDKYTAYIKQLQQTDPIIQQVAAGGADAWDKAFAAAG